MLVMFCEESATCEKEEVLVARQKKKIKIALLNFLNENILFSL